MSKVKALVLAGYGLNCERETAHAFELAGAAAEIVHINQLTGTPRQAPSHTLEGYSIVCFGGGFSWGDDHGGGILLATRLANHLGGQIEDFLARGGLILGICNGFQALVNLGLLPWLRGEGRMRQVALIGNDCGNFQDRWVETVADESSPCVFTRGIRRLDMPIRHGEGKFICQTETLEAMRTQGCLALRYGDGNGEAAGGAFPANPNGSADDIAGICDPSGRIFGLMPHPEGYYRISQHPDWPLWREIGRRKGSAPRAADPGDGLKIFRNAVEEAEKI